MRTTTATTHVECLCICPNCGSALDIMEKDSVREELTRQDEFSSSNCDLEITCNECNKEFLVTDIYY